MANGQLPNQQADSEAAWNAASTQLTDHAIASEERLCRIRDQAYYYWLRRNGHEDKALNDWLQAEADVDRELVKGNADER